MQVTETKQYLWQFSVSVSHTGDQFGDCLFLGHVMINPDPRMHRCLKRSPKTSRRFVYLGAATKWWGLDVQNGGGGTWSRGGGVEMGLGDTETYVTNIRRSHSLDHRFCGFFQHLG